MAYTEKREKLLGSGNPGTALACGNYMKNLVIYLPMSWPQISSRVFTSIVDLISPENIDELRSKYEVEPKILINDKFPLCRNRCDSVDQALSSKYEADYILFLDGDMIFPKKMAQRLLDRLIEFPDHGLVSGLYFRKAPPHYAIQGKYSPWTKDLENRKESLKANGFIDGDGNQCLFYRPLQDFHSIQDIDVAGMGCIIARAEVFKKIDQPYFGYTNEFTTQDYSLSHASEEMLTYAKFKKAGIKTLVDPTIRCGHLKEVVFGCAEQDK